MQTHNETTKKEPKKRNFLSEVSHLVVIIGAQEEINYLQNLTNITSNHKGERIS